MSNQPTPPPGTEPHAAAALAVDSRCVLGEGILWCPRRQAWLWTDIQSARLWAHWPDARVTRQWALPDRLGSFALCRSGRVLLGLAKSLALADIDRADRDELPVATLVALEPDLPSTRINDGRTDRSGNFVFGTMNEDPSRSPVGSFYQFSGQRGLRRLDLGHIAIPNSICFSLNGRTMYFCDTVEGRIMQGDYDADSAKVTGVREFVNFDPLTGSPDGSIVDSDGHVWNAAWGAGIVRRFTPVGAVEREVALPAKNLTCPAFGGTGLDELYVTSARQKMTPEELQQMPEAGGVFRIVPGLVRGVPEPLFNDL